MRGNKKLTAIAAGTCGLILLGGCAQRSATMRVVNETQEPIVLKPAVKTSFISHTQDEIELAPGEEWAHSWDLERGSWVMVRFLRQDDDDEASIENLRLRTVEPGERVDVRATPDEEGRLAKIVTE